MLVGSADVKTVVFAPEDARGGVVLAGISTVRSAVGTCRYAEAWTQGAFQNLENLDCDSSRTDGEVVFVGFDETLEFLCGLENSGEV